MPFSCVCTYTGPVTGKYSVAGAPACGELGGGPRGAHAEA